MSTPQPQARGRNTYQPPAIEDDIAQYAPPSPGGGFALQPLIPRKSERRKSVSPRSATAVGGSTRPGPNSSKGSLIPAPRLQRALRHEFDPNKQFSVLFLRGLRRFFLSVVLMSLLVITIWQFARRQVISKKWKRWFNAINLGLSMALGMSVQKGFKGMAVDIRWWILSRRKRSLSEVDMVLRSESLTVVARLLFSCLRTPFKRFKMILLCTFWLLVNVGSQIGIAVMGLNYGAEVDDVFALSKPGPVLIPNMTQIYPVGFSKDLQNPLGAQQYTANSFGNMALGFDYDSISQRPPTGAFWKPGVHYYLDEDYRSWTFVFLDWSPPNGEYPVYTDRSISSSWSCQSWLVTMGGNGTMSNLTVAHDANGGVFNVSVPTIGGPDQTTFFTSPEKDCGEGCGVVEAFEASAVKPWYYKCNITVGTVQNGTLPEHEVGRSLRQMASSAIALQGYGVKSALPGTRQYQVYPSQSAYGQPQRGSDNGMGQLIGQFAIGVVAASAIYTNQSLWLTVHGERPQIGSQLTVENWVFIWLIVGIIIGAQGIGFVITTFWANNVLVKDESVLSTATLLRPAMRDLGSSGNSARSKAICKVLADKEVIYTVVSHEDDESLLHLEFTELASDMRFRSHRAFPAGTYD
ncbi:hypothetical protein B0O99DRAFT_680379 [Bisporella sp. PMI_857]|nr:hypothetical protein B0O99DRAFT_680379 [Bisporella sp. PMI_857]